MMMFSSIVAAILYCLFVRYSVKNTNIFVQMLATVAWVSVPIAFVAFGLLYELAKLDQLPPWL